MKKNIFAIFYKRQLICDNFLLFMPCSYGDGIYDSTDHSFIDHSGHPYYGCDNYDMVTDTVDLTYYFDISHDDLRNRYAINNAYEALSKFYDEICDVVLLGYIDHKKKRIDIMSLSREKMRSLTFTPTYQINDDKEGFVKITKTQLESLLTSKSLSEIKRSLSQYFEKTKAIENLSQKKNVQQVKTDPNGKQIIEIVTAYQSNPLSLTEQSLQKKLQEKKKNFDTKKIYEYITSCLIGQDEVVKDIVSAVISNIQATNPEEIIKPFLIGETGSGKSFLFKLLGKSLDIPVIIVDCNTIVQEGYHGKSVDNVLADLYYLCNKDLKKVQRAIVFFDEVDKLASRGNTVSDIGAQQALLKVLEGHKFAVEIDKFGNKVVIDTSMMTIACGGAFSEIYERQKHPIGIRQQDDEQMKIREKITDADVIEYGLIPEFTARCNLWEQYNKVTKEMLMKQLQKGLLSPTLIKQRVYLRDYGTILIFENSYYEKLCDNALAKKSGFRGLDKVVNDSLIKANFALQISSVPYKRLIVQAETIDDPKKYILER